MMLKYIKLNPEGPRRNHRRKFLNNLKVPALFGGKVCVFFRKERKDVFADRCVFVGSRCFSFPVRFGSLEGLVWCCC